MELPTVGTSCHPPQQFLLSIQNCIPKSQLLYLKLFHKSKIVIHVVLYYNGEGTDTSYAYHLFISSLNTDNLCNLSEPRIDINIVYTS
jgi:hypothetical protein